jgi:hypothetical protein
MSFFSLPAELRICVYDALWAGALLTFYEGDLEFKLAYKPRMHLALPLWLPTYKQMLDEGLEQLYREAVCRLDCLPLSRRGRSQSQLIERSDAHLLRLDRVQTLEYDWSPFFDNLPIQLGPWRNDANDVNHSGVVLPAFDRLPHSQLEGILGEKLMHELIASNGYSVKDIKITFEIQVEDAVPVDDPSSWSVDLSSFEKLAPLDRIVFEICCPQLCSTPTVTQGYDALRQIAIVYPKVQREIERVARALVAGSGKDGDRASPSPYSIHDFYKHFAPTWDGRPTKGAKSWLLEAKRLRRPSNTGRPAISHLGLQYYLRDNARPSGMRFFGPAVVSEDSISWQCNQSESKQADAHQVMLLSLPLESFVKQIAPVDGVGLFRPEYFTRYRLSGLACQTESTLIS